MPGLTGLEYQIWSNRGEGISITSLEKQSEENGQVWFGKWLPICSALKSDWDKWCDKSYDGIVLSEEEEKKEKEGKEKKKDDRGKNEMDKVTERTMGMAQ